jgi:23S rRNA pseudouridine1911/1915/1917 synthase
MEKNNYPEYIERKFEFRIAAGQKSVRIDAFLAESLRHASRTKVQAAIDAGLVLMNGAPVKHSRKIQPGDHIVCTIMKPPPMELVPENIPLQIHFEDEHLLVVHKPAGMVTHPGFGNRYGTLVNALLWHFGTRESIVVETPEADDDETEQNEEDYVTGSDEEDVSYNEGALYAGAGVRPGIVHRLDKDTSGILVVAKHAQAHAKLAVQFAERTAKREYYALVWGNIAEDEGTIEGNIGRSSRNRQMFAVVDSKHGKHAVTDYKVEERFSFMTLLRLRLRTGRTHQIRVHCSHHKHPLLSDAMYGGSNILYGGNSSTHISFVQKLFSALPRQALHAKSLGFKHPFTKEWMQFDSELPDDFTRALSLLRERALA